MNILQGNHIGDDEAFYYMRCVESKNWGQGDRRKALDLISQHHRVGSINNMLEVGCGVGDIIPHLPPKIAYTGLDPVRYAIEEARRRHEGHRFVVGNAVDLPFEDESFDLVFSSQTIEMFASPREALREMARVIRPGGFFLAVAPNLECPWGRVNSIRHYSWFRRALFVASRIVDLSLRFLGFSRFRTIPETQVEATGKFEKKDDDLKHVASAWEINRALEGYGFREVYTKKASSPILRSIGPLRFYGGGMFLFLQKTSNYPHQ